MSLIQNYTDLVDDSQMTGLSGLQNMGNTCYMNSAIQCLSNTKELRDFFLSEEFKRDMDESKPESKMTREFFRLLIGLHEESCIVIPKGFWKTMVSFNPELNNHNQHDSQEALSLLLDLLHKSMPLEMSMTFKLMSDKLRPIDKMMIDAIKTWSKCYGTKYSKILEIFFGQYHSCLKCNNPKCQQISSNYDPFSLLILPITNDEINWSKYQPYLDKCPTEYEKQNMMLKVMQLHNQKQQNIKTNIYKCLDSFVKEEVLCKDNKWKCDKCNQYSQACKKMQLWKTPNILILVIKRFNHIPYTHKNNTYVDFPLYAFDLKPYVGGPDKFKSVYDAYAIINHRGNINGGHYFSYVKKEDEKWYIFDDETVLPMKNNFSLKDAYVIFYRKRLS